MGFLDKLKQAADAAQRIAEQTGIGQQPNQYPPPGQYPPPPGQYPPPPGQYPPPPGQYPPSGGQPDSPLSPPPPPPGGGLTPPPPPPDGGLTPPTAPLTTPASPGGAGGPPFPPPQPQQQSFRLERALNGSVGSATATARRWPASRWAGQYPHLGADRFECVLTIPPGAAGPGPFELRLSLDPFRPNGGYRTPSFDNSVVLREELTGRTWRADRRKGMGTIVVNPDGVSGIFRRFYLRLQDRPSDRSAFVILDGAWRAAV
jgi:hypothetical protein